MPDDREIVTIHLGGKSFNLNAPKGLSNEELIRRAIRVDSEFATLAKTNPHTAQFAAQEQAHARTKQLPMDRTGQNETLGNLVKNAYNLTGRVKGRVKEAYGQEVPYVPAGSEEHTLLTGAEPGLQAMSTVGTLGNLATNPWATTKALGKMIALGYGGAKAGKYVAGTPGEIVGGTLAPLIGGGRMLEGKEPFKVPTNRGELLDMALNLVGKGKAPAVTPEVAEPMGKYPSAEEFKGIQEGHKEFAKPFSGKPEGFYGPRMEELTEQGKLREMEAKDVAQEAKEARIREARQTRELERRITENERERQRRITESAKMATLEGKERAAAEKAHEKNMRDLWDERQDILAQQEKLKEQHAKSLMAREEEEAPAEPAPKPTKPEVGLVSKAPGGYTGPKSVPKASKTAKTTATTGAPVPAAGPPAKPPAKTGTKPTDPPSPVASTAPPPEWFQVEQSEEGSAGSLASWTPEQLFKAYMTKYRGTGTPFEQAILRELRRKGLIP